MNWKSTFILGGLSSALSAMACIIYSKIYEVAFYVDFSQVIGLTNMVAASAVGCFLMSVGYKVILGWKGIRMLGWLNILYSTLSFASIAGVLAFNLPLEVEFPEMFPGFVIPMHFFPVLALLNIFSFTSIKNKYQ